MRDHEGVLRVLRALKTIVLYRIKLFSKACYSFSTDGNWRMKMKMSAGCGCELSVREWRLGERREELRLILILYALGNLGFKNVN